MHRIAFIIGLAIGLMGGTAYGQSCYSDSYGGAQVYESPAFDVIIPGETIQLPERRIRLQAQPQVIQPQPQSYRVLPQAQSYGQLQACPGGVCTIQGGYGYSGGFGGYAAPMSYGQGYGYGAQFGGFNRGFGASSFGDYGTGVSFFGRDHRGNQFMANGLNSVRIHRGFDGEIRGASVDLPRRHHFLLRAFIHGLSPF